ncbi:helix-turn-helix transcriptional regulator [Victivallis vadensis]|uniref:helix-turn-helix domain-containing protein n=1 Tax=Victivallis vadensis TaxID=172901 RepID=UPI00307D9288
MLKSFGERLKAIREEKKITQAELAEKTGIKQSAISSYENDKYMPNIENLRAICNALNVSAADLDTRFMELEKQHPLIGNFSSGDSANQFSGIGKLVQHASSASELKAAKQQILHELLQEVATLKAEQVSPMEIIRIISAKLNAL